MLLIRHIEERSLNALPALRTIYYDGWILRFADGYTRRANSVNALYPPSLPLDEKIAYCEQAYTQAGRDVIFKLTDAVQPAHLDAALAEKGYAKTAETGVQTLALAARTLPPVRESSSDLTIAARLTPAWLAVYRRFNRVPEQNARTLRRMLAGIQPRAAQGVFQVRGMSSGHDMSCPYQNTRHSHFVE